MNGEVALTLATRGPGEVVSWAAEIEAAGRRAGISVRRA
jgi:hypothetical protein